MIEAVFLLYPYLFEWIKNTTKQSIWDAVSWKELTVEILAHKYTTTKTTQHWKNQDEWSSDGHSQWVTPQLAVLRTPLSEAVTTLADLENVQN